MFRDWSHSIERRIERNDRGITSMAIIGLCGFLAAASSVIYIHNHDTPAPPPVIVSDKTGPEHKQPASLGIADGNKVKHYDLSELAAGIIGVAGAFAGIIATGVGIVDSPSRKRR